MSHDPECCCNPCWVRWMRSLPPPAKRRALTPDEVTAANRAAQPDRIPPDHGTRPSYVAGCREACCLAAEADYRRRLRAARRAS